jgi:hypothetical protein
MARPSSFTKEQEQEIGNLYKSGKSLRELANLFNISNPGILKVLRRNNISIRNKQDASYIKNGILTYLQNKYPVTIPQLPGYPSIAAVTCTLGVVVLDPREWDVLSIMKRNAVSHAVAKNYLVVLNNHIAAFNLKPLFIWLDELPKILHIIEHKSQGSSRTCSARECEVRIIDNKIAGSFYEAHHLQGACNSGITYGLIFNNSLVACMTFNHASSCRSSLADHLLQRFACIGSIPGAASKLLAAFRKEHAGSIVSYSDQRYAAGGLYRTLGFTCHIIGSPDYRYFRDRWYAKNTKQRKHLISELSSKGMEVYADDTEYTMAERLGYRRCYDCGKITWILPALAKP